MKRLQKLMAFAALATMAGIAGAAVVEPCASVSHVLARPHLQESWVRQCAAASPGRPRARAECEAFLERCRRYPISPTF